VIHRKLQCGLASLRELTAASLSDNPDKRPGTQLLI
jgi:hypothetical protein